MNLLFICNQNKHRSKTAEHLFSRKFTTRSAGLYNTTPIDETQLEWADTVVVMENHQRQEIGKRFPKQYLKKRILSFDIPDVYTYNQQELIALLHKRAKELL